MGYDRRWRKIRARKLRADPMCEWPGCTAKANEVDHIVTLEAGGTHHPTNLQSLCKPHHSYKTAVSDGGFGR